MYKYCKKSVFVSAGIWLERKVHRRWDPKIFGQIARRLCSGRTARLLFWTAGHSVVVKEWKCSVPSPRCIKHRSTIRESSEFAGDDSVRFCPDFGRFRFAGGDIKGKLIAVSADPKIKRKHNERNRKNSRQQTVPTSDDLYSGTQMTINLPPRERWGLFRRRR